MSATVAVVGSINRDLLLRVDTLPRPGETILGASLASGPGGKGANQAVAARRAGADTTMIGCVGSDGRALLRSLHHRGVDTDGVVIDDDEPTGTAIVLVDDAGENSIVVASGANHRLTPESVVSHLAGLDPRTIVLSQCEIPVACIAAAAATSRRRGLRFALNQAPFVVLPAEVLASADPLILNEVEAQELCDHLGMTPSQDPASLARELCTVARSVVLTLGGRGAVLGTADDVTTVPAPVVEVVDTTGAGDSFAGALAAALAKGASLADAVASGVLAGSAAVGHHGAQPPTEPDTA